MSELCTSDGLAVKHTLRCLPLAVSPFIYSLSCQGSKAGPFWRKYFLLMGTPKLSVLLLLSEVYQTRGGFGCVFSWPLLA